MLTAETDQVPYDQEVAGESKFFDQDEFTLNLALGTGFQVCGCPSIALLETFAGPLAQKRHHALAFGHGIFGKLIAQIFEREVEPRGKLCSVGNGLREIGEKFRHGLRRFQVALGIARKQASGSGQSAMMAKRGKHVTEFAVARSRVADAICGQQRQLERMSDFDGGVVEAPAGDESGVEVRHKCCPGQRFP